MVRFAFTIALLIASLTPRVLFAQEAAPPQESKAQESKVFDAASFTLENGLEIVVVENHRAPVVTHMVWYKTGAADETPGVSGIAHFMEHLMFKGSEGLAPGEFSEKIRALGGNDNAFTSQDYTAYFQSISAAHLETVMTMEAGRMRGMNPPLEQVESERKVILEERRQRTDNNPSERLSEHMNAALYPNHPYGTPIIGWYHEMEQLGWDDAKSFYDRWYAPNNAILIVSGDVEPHNVLALAQKIYGPLERVDVPARERTKIPPLEASSTLTLKHPSVQQPAIQTAYRVPSYRMNPEESLAIQVLVEIMGSGPTSRLYRSLVVDQKLATGAGTFYRDAALDQTSFWLYATPAEGIAPEVAINSAYDEMRTLIRDGVSAEELQKAQLRLQDQAIFARDSLSGPAMIIGQALATGSSLDQIETWPQQVSAVTTAQIQAVAAKYLNPDIPIGNPPVTGILLPDTDTSKPVTPPVQTGNAP
jgi:zinc protease